MTVTPLSACVPQDQTYAMEAMDRASTRHRATRPSQAMSQRTRKPEPTYQQPRGRVKFTDDLDDIFEDSEDSGESDSSEKLRRLEQRRQKLAPQRTRVDDEPRGNVADNILDFFS